MTNYVEGQAVTGDGLRLYLQAWRPEGEPRAALVLTHGQGDHSTRYRHVGQALAAGGYAVQAYDLRGHGKSAGPRGHAPSYQSLLDDLQIVYDQTKRSYPGKPLFLFGHSTGGQISLNFAIRRKPDAAGVVVTAPWLRLVLPVPAWKMRAGRVLARVWPTFTFDNTLGDVAMSHDQAFHESLRDLTLEHTKLTSRLGTELFDAADDALARAGELQLPLLLMHGLGDTIVDPAATQEFYERAGSADKTLKTYPGMYHEILNEAERETVFGDILAWLDRHAPRT